MKTLNEVADQLDRLADEIEKMKPGRARLATIDRIINGPDGRPPGDLVRWHDRLAAEGGELLPTISEIITLVSQYRVWCSGMGERRAQYLDAPPSAAELRLLTKRLRGVERGSTPLRSVPPVECPTVLRLRELLAHWSHPERWQRAVREYADWRWEWDQSSYWAARAYKLKFPRDESIVRGSDAEILDAETTAARHREAEPVKHRLWVASLDELTEIRLWLAQNAPAIGANLPGGDIQSMDDDATRAAADAMRRITWMVEGHLRDAEPSGRGERGEEKPDARHSPDFASVYWFGSTHTFTTNQAACVKVLWDAWENKTPVLAEATIQDAAGVDSPMRGVFRGHDAWETMIVSPSKGRFCLQSPAAS